jgi:hypothetical protein
MEMGFVKLNGLSRGNSGKKVGIGELNDLSLGELREAGVSL